MPYKFSRDVVNAAKPLPDLDLSALAALARSCAHRILEGNPATHELHSLAWTFRSTPDPIVRGILEAANLGNAVTTLSAQQWEAFSRVFNALPNRADHEPADAPEVAERVAVRSKLAERLLSEMSAYQGALALFASSAPALATDLLVALPPNTSALPKPQMVAIWRSLLPDLVPPDGLAKPNADVREWDDRHGMKSGEICKNAQAVMGRYYKGLRALQEIDPALAQEAERIEGERSRAFDQHEATRGSQEREERNSRRQ